MPNVNLLPALTLALSVRDRRASAEWYIEKLGFSERFDAAEIGYCEITTSVPGVAIGLADREEITTGGVVPTFEVDDIESARNHLERLGVQFDGPTFGYEGMVRLAAFTDLDGHTLMLAQDMMK